MDVIIDVNEYLSQDDIKDAALRALEQMFYNQLRKESEIDRVLSNLSGEYIFSRVCEHLKISREEIERVIVDKIRDALTGDYIKYQVFRRKDAWDRSESPAVGILDDVLKGCRPIIEEEVEKRIAEYDFRELREEIENTIYGVICRKLREGDD